MAFRETAHFSGGDFRELELEVDMLVCEDCSGAPLWHSKHWSLYQVGRKEVVPFGGSKGWREVV